MKAHLWKICTPKHVLLRFNHTAKWSLWHGNDNWFIGIKIQTYSRFSLRIRGIRATNATVMAYTSFNMHHSRQKYVFTMYTTETHVEASFPALNLKFTVNAVNACNEGPFLENMYAETCEKSSFAWIISWIIYVSCWSHSHPAMHPACKVAHFQIVHFQNI